MSVPRLRMFAGPNGSGKSTLKSWLPKVLLGVYLNPDEVEQELGRQRFLELATYGVTTTADEVLTFFKNSSFLITDGVALDLKSDQVPAWFKRSVLDKINPPPE